jgi:hypothetical protein
MTRGAFRWHAGLRSTNSTSERGAQRSSHTTPDGQQHTMKQRQDQPPRSERWRSVLSAALLEDEQVIAEGRANEMHAGSGYLYLLVTRDRILWTDYLMPERVSALAFALVTAFREAYESHRYLLRMRHAPVSRLERAPQHRVLWFEWGNTMQSKEARETQFLFSRADTRAARAIRERLAVLRNRPHI